MPWNQSDKDGKSPWDGNQKGPPDIDELLRKFFSSFFKSGSGKGADSSPPSQWSGKAKAVLFPLATLAFLVLWLASGIYIINEGQRGIELRFGAYKVTTVPGPHWHIPFPVESVEKVDVDRIRSVQNKTRMLTRDENIVEVELAVQYRVKDAANYLFKVRFPDASGPGVAESEGTIFQVMESALREVVGRNNMDFILGAGRAEIASQTRGLMHGILDSYQSGLEVISVNLQQSQPPAAVQDAFADAIKAREDKIRFINEAETYANGIIPQARGEAARIEQEASAYREKVTANAEGEADRFTKIYQEYAKAPKVTRERLYLQAMQEVLTGTTKVIMDVRGGNNVFYLPLEPLLRNKTIKDAANGTKSQLTDDFGDNALAPAERRDRRRAQQRSR